MSSKTLRKILLPWHKHQQPQYQAHQGAQDVCGASPLFCSQPLQHSQTYLHGGNGGGGVSPQP